MGKFEFIKELGRGSFGSVVLARNTRTGEQVAIKKMERAHLQRYVESEILNHSQLRHPHVVQFREVFLSPHHINIVMHYASGGSLFSYVQSRNRLREPLARWFFQQLILAVDYCHRKGVANRDIKLENTLLEIIPGIPLPLVKICDFGYSKHDNRSVAHSKVGSLTYMAPEVLQSKSYDGKTADIWSCGVVLYTMLVGRYPFQSNAGDGVGLGHEVMEMLKKMKSQEYHLPDSLNLTPECKNLLCQMLEPHSQKRINMAGILSDPWFRTNLPPEALTMNDKYVAKTPTSLQSEADIKAIVAAAAATVAGDVGGLGEVVVDRAPAVLQRGSDVDHSPVTVPSAQCQQQQQQPAGAPAQHQQQATEGTPDLQSPVAAEPATAVARAASAVPLLSVPSFKAREQLDLGFAMAESAVACCSSTSRQVLLLQLPPQEVQQHSHRLTEQLQAAIQLRHPHVLQLANVYYRCHRLNLVLEPCKVTLLQYVEQHGGRLSEEFALWLFQQLVLGVDYCHREGVAGIPVQHTLVQVVPNLPQPVVKVLPVPLMGGTSDQLWPCSTAVTAAAASTSHSSRQQLEKESSWEQRVLHDVVNCGYLLVIMLGGKVAAAATAAAPSQQQHGEQALFVLPAAVSSACQQFLQQLLQPEDRSLHTTGDVIRHPWFAKDLPAAATSLTSTRPQNNQEVQQQGKDVAAAVEAAAAAATASIIERPSLVQLQQLQQGSRLLQQLQQTCSLMAQQLPPQTLLHVSVQYCLYQAAVAVASTNQALYLLTVGGTDPTCGKLGAADIDSAKGSRTNATTIVEQQWQQSQVQQHQLQESRMQQQQQGQDQQLPTALQLALTRAKSSLNDLIQTLQLSSQQRQQQHRQQQPTHQLQPHGGVLLLLQLLQIGWQLLASAQQAAAALQACRAAAACVVTAFTHQAMPVLPRHGIPVLSRRCQSTASQLAYLLRPGSALQLPLLLCSVLGTVSVEVVVGLFALLLLLPASLVPALSIGNPTGSIAVYDKLQQLPADLYVRQQIMPDSTDSNIRVVFAADQQDRSLWIVGLPVRDKPKGYNVTGSRDGRDQQQQELKATADHPCLLAAQQQQLPCSLQQYQPFLQLVQQLSHTCTSPQHAARAGQFSSSSGGDALFSPVVGVCSSPPLLLLEQPVGDTLENWLIRQQQLTRGVASGSTSSSFWAQNAPWPMLLQVLREIAEALCIMRQLPQPAAHGYVHAGVVNLLHSLPDCMGVVLQHELAQEQQQQLKQQERPEQDPAPKSLRHSPHYQDEVQPDGPRLAQLSLIGPWRQAVSKARSHRPCLTAGEVLLTGAHLSAATDVYGFGMLMLQLAACWVPVRPLPGSDAQPAQFRWRYKMLQRTGSTFPCSDVGATLAAEIAASSWDLKQTGIEEWLPQLPPAELLPSGYMHLVYDCCNTDAATRPSAQAILQRLRNLHPPR